MKSLEETEVAHSLQQPASWLKFSGSTSVSAQHNSACLKSLTDPQLLGMAFPKQLSFQCPIKQLAGKSDPITKITRKSIHHTTLLRKTCFKIFVCLNLFHMFQTLPVQSKTWVLNIYQFKLNQFILWAYQCTLVVAKICSLNGKKP